MASYALKLLAEKDFPGAVALACHGASLVRGEGFFEANALAAIVLEQAGDYRTALEFWERIVRSAPQKLNFLDAALKACFRMEHREPLAAEKIDNWQELLGWVYTSIPQFELLDELTRRGWQGIGSTGIKSGRLLGWLWLDRDEMPTVRIDGPKNVELELKLKPIKASQERILYGLNAKLPEQACAITIRDSKGTLVTGAPAAIAPAASARSKSSDKQLKIIIPVYGDRRSTLACIGSVLASQKKNSAKFGIIVIWDNGPDQKLLADLRRLHAKGKMRLLENQANYGFIVSVNRAIAECGGDVLLLNSDTLVHGNWIERMCAAALKPNVASVTALGNEAELMSYPGPGDRGTIEGLHQVRLYDEAASRLGPDAMLEIPVGVGFCMLITRKAINRIGGLDGRTLFRGYGEEVDFCLRAKSAGFKNYGLFNVFIGHIGGRSFGGAKKALAAQNNEVIFDRFPEYRREYEISLAKPSASRLRARLSLALLRNMPTVEIIELRPWAMRYLPPWIKDDVYKPHRKGAALFLKPGEGSQAILRVWSDLPLAEMDFDLPEEQESLARALADLGVRKFRDFSGSGKIKRVFLDLGIESVEEELAAVTADLPELGVIQAPATLLAAPPATLAGLDALKTLAQRYVEVTIYIMHMESLWKGAPVPGNIVSMPKLASYSAIQPTAFILPDNYADAVAWREWLDCHGCADVAICRASA